MPTVQTINGNHTYVFKYGDERKDEKHLFQSVGKLACSSDVNFNWRNASSNMLACLPRRASVISRTRKKEISFVNNFVRLVEQLFYFAY